MLVLRMLILEEQQGLQTGTEAQRDVNYVDGAFPVPAATSDREAHREDLASRSC